MSALGDFIDGLECPITRKVQDKIERGPIEGRRRTHRLEPGGTLDSTPKARGQTGQTWGAKNLAKCLLVLGPKRSLLGSVLGIPTRLNMNMYSIPSRDDA